ncbi:hypothetical protein Patl1_20408 [Pistacia atlantica]|uniref:Uncharacterized protein n=1 Tax=Pistacia atlantica TaxID=434234 RepID=A0ACC1BLV0_9ROSI|nr:hypothetical protein Patl1_20408 [Pistacia atlantica]
MQEKTLLKYYTEIKQAFEEKKAMFPVPTDVKMMQAQEKQVVVHFPFLHMSLLDFSKLVRGRLRSI